MEELCKCERCSKDYQYKPKSNCTKTKCKSCYIAFNRKDRKRTAIELFGGCCQKCGYSRHDNALSFHHIDPKEKSFAISCLQTVKWERYVDELKKCSLLCFNCHIELHAGLWDISEIQRVKLGDDAYNIVLSTGRPPLQLRKKLSCKYCTRIFEADHANRNKYCSEDCFHKMNRKAERPTKEQLIEEISQNSWTALGRKYGVTDNAVRKWARGYGIL